MALVKTSIVPIFKVDVLHVLCVLKTCASVWQNSFLHFETGYLYFGRIRESDDTFFGFENCVFEKKINYLANSHIQYGPCRLVYAVTLQSEFLLTFLNS